MANRDIEKRRATQRKADRKWYLKNKSKRREANRKCTQRNREWLREYKKTQKCSICPEDHPATLDFHHVDSSTKKFSIGDAANLGYSIRRMQSEIAKCITICANCHRKLHWDEKT